MVVTNDAVVWANVCVHGGTCSGEEILQLIESAGSPLEEEGKPTTTVVIADCGILTEEEFTAALSEPEPEPE